MTSRMWSTMLVGSAVVVACLGGAGLALAAGGAGGAVGTGSAAPCGQLTVQDPALVVRNLSRPPSAKFTVTNCGTSTLQAHVVVSEGTSELQAICPVPFTTDPVATTTLAAGKRASFEAGAYRGPCGWNSNRSAIIWTTLGWQSRNFRLALVDDASGTELSSGTYSVSDNPAAA